MPSKPETKFRLRVEKLLPASIYKLKLNVMFTAGVADSWYSGSSDDLWVEWKYLARLPKEGEVDLGLSTLQKLWLRGRWREGRNIAVIVGWAEGGVVMRDMTWEDPWSPARIRQHTRNLPLVAGYIRDCTE